MFQKQLVYMRAADTHPYHFYMKNLEKPEAEKIGDSVRHKAKIAQGWCQLAEN